MLLARLNSFWPRAGGPLGISATGHRHVPVKIVRTTLPRLLPYVQQTHVHEISCCLTTGADLGLLAGGLSQS